MTARHGGFLVCLESHVWLFHTCVCVCVLRVFVFGGGCPPHCCLFLERTNASLSRYEDMGVAELRLHMAEYGMKGARKDVMVRKLRSIWKGLREPSPACYVTASARQPQQAGAGGAGRRNGHSHGDNDNDNDNDGGISLSPIRSMPHLTPMMVTANGTSTTSRCRRRRRQRVDDSTDITNTVVPNDDDELDADCRDVLRVTLRAIIARGGGETDHSDDNTCWSLAKKLATRQTVELAAVQAALAERGVSCSNKSLEQFLKDSGVAHHVPWRT